MSNEDFYKEIRESIEIYEDLIGRVAARTRRMIIGHGEINALSILMKSPDLQMGFKKLRDSNQLDKTFEFIVVKYAGLFDPTVVQAAQWRLENPYDLINK